MFGCAQELSNLVPCEPRRHSTVLDLLKMVVFSFVRCWHFNKGPIISCRPDQPRTAVAAITGTYLVCLGCGKEYAYDLKTFRVIDPEPSRVRLIANKITELCRRKSSSRMRSEHEVY
jgi:hypothetical protein